ncbi:hypothetical protein [Sphaerisporangium corydalis]|uniref:RNA polymerase sigma factor 70 region 4 type 2 domain-containing protein n=1 Tax=Sphaerisporangium corydalis TaxID=1441875 RepID=A0ABV9EHJ0_9ACTN|nr:hypothetical protein [Sphaerisporangium corydalis]
MTPSLTDRRPRGELVAELYDRNAAGLYAYCHDQLGGTTSAADALVAVFENVPAVEPPRAALYALARREIYRRDVAYAFPSVDPAVDPATALIERVIREVRPHQREVLLLSAVCGLDVVELAWVLDVAADTAEQLVLSARQRFGHSLSTAVTSALPAPSAPPAVAEAYGALAVAPIEDALARLPWRAPSLGLRVRILSAIPEDATTATARPAGELRWPTTPRWPLPLADPNPFTNTGVFPAQELTPPKPGRRSRHEATTEPMPKVRVPGQRNSLVKPPPASHAAPPAPPQAPPVSHAAPPPPPPAPPAFREAPPPPPDTLVASSAKPVAPDVPEAAGSTAVDEPAGVRAPMPKRSFGDALAAGNWPTLQRTFAAGRPPAKTEGAETEAVPASAEPEPSLSTEPDTASVLARLAVAARTAVTHAVAARTAVTHAVAARTAVTHAVAARTAFTHAVAARMASTRAPAEPDTSATPAEETSSTVVSPVSPVSPVTPVDEPQDGPAARGSALAEPEGPYDTKATPDPVVPIVPVFSVKATRARTKADSASEAKDDAAEAAETDAAPFGAEPATRHRHDRLKPIKLGEHHFDWLWELGGFILCVLIALLVFMLMPGIITR